MKQVLISFLFVLSYMTMVSFADAQEVNVHKQNENLGRGVNIIGYDKAFLEG